MSKELERLYHIRRIFGWTVVVMSAVLTGIGAYMVYRFITVDAHPLFLLEPAIFFVAGVYFYMRFARSFFDPSQCGLPEDYQ